MATETKKQRKAREQTVKFLREALARESQQRTPGTIQRCTDLYRLINLKRARLA